jgi:hypothetical protein
MIGEGGRRIYQSAVLLVKVGMFPEAPEISPGHPFILFLPSRE